jgi:hypothetical protein
MGVGRLKLLRLNDLRFLLLVNSSFQTACRQNIDYKWDSVREVSGLVDFEFYIQYSGLGITHRTSGYCCFVMV